jgi:hypothetical protein
MAPGPDAPASRAADHAAGCRPERGFGDVLRALRWLEVNDLVEARAICELLLGTATDPWATPPGGGSPIDVTHQGALEAFAPAVVAEGLGIQRDAHRERVEIPTQLVEIDERTDDARNPGPSAGDTLPRERHESWEQSPAPLFRPEVERGILRELASTVLPSHAVDVDALVDALARVEPPVPLPYLKESTTRRGVQLLLDRGPRMLGFSRDVRGIERRFATLLGSERIEVLRFRDVPTRVISDSNDTWRPYRPPAPFVPIVVVTALTALSERVFLPFVEHWRRQGRSVTFVVPHGLERCAGGIGVKARVVHWESKTTAHSARHSRTRLRPLGRSQARDPVRRLWERNPVALRLARFASLAAFVEPALLRELRVGLMPESSSAAELDLWTSSLVESATPDGFVIAAQSVEQLRAEAARDTRFGEAIAIIRRLHAQAPTLLRLEEQLIEDSLSPPGAQASRADRDAAIARALERVLGTMERSGERTGSLAHWFVRAATRLPRLALRSERGRLLSFVAAAHVRSAPRSDPALSDAALRRATALLPRKEVFVAVRPTIHGEERQLELLQIESPRGVDASWHVLRVQKSDPLFVFVDNVRWTVGKMPVLVNVGGRVSLRDIGGKRWELYPRDESWTAVALVREGTNAESTTFAYLIGEDLCVTSRSDYTEELVLEFAWGTRTARVIPLTFSSGSSSLGFNFLRLSEPVTAAPLPLGSDLEPSDDWEVLFTREQRLKGRGVESYETRDIALPLERHITDPAVQAKMRGGPVLVNGQLAAHVGRVAATALHVVRASELRRAWALAHVGSIAGVSERFASIAAFHEKADSGNGAPAIAVGRRTFISAGGFGSDGYAIRPHRGAPVAASQLIQLRSQFWIAVADEPEPSDPDSMGEMSEPATETGHNDTARTAHFEVDFVSATGRSPTFVCMHAAGRQLIFYPCPIAMRDSSDVALDLRSNPFQVGAGSPVFQHGRLVGLTRDREQGWARIRTIVECVRDAAIEFLEPDDWARLGRRLQIREDTPTATLEAISSASARSELQFALDQAVRRLEYRQRVSRGEYGALEPHRTTLLRAEFRLDERGRPRATGGAGVRNYEIRIWIEDPTRRIRRVEYELDQTYVQRRQVAEISRGLAIEVLSYGNYAFAAVLESSAAPPLRLRALLCDVLDETCLANLARPHADRVAIEDAIDDLRSR